MSSEPLSVLIGALGGEGGGVLADWVARAAAACGYPVQRTSIPGVAQRTGATTYYLEILPVRRDQLSDREPVLALSPVPGRIDLVVASELLEAGRAVQQGLISPERTAVVASSHRVFTVAEKAAMADARYDSNALRRVLERFAKRAIVFDMDAVAREAGTVISAVMLGALARANVLPLPRRAFEDAIRGAGTGVAASLEGFAAGYAAAGGTAVPPAPPTPAAGLAARPVPAARRDPMRAVRDRFPAPLSALVEAGYLRQADYQDRRYAELYLERVVRVYAAERVHAGGPDFPVTAACARFLGLWMSYEDVIRVADLKSRAGREQRIRAEAGAGPGDLLRVIEYMKPGLEEWCALLPAALARPLRRRAEKRGTRLNLGLHIRTTSLHGLLLLRLLRGLRWWRPYTWRYADEQRLIERWLAAVVEAAGRDRALALEIAQCGRLIKGYGETHARGKASFLRILDTLVAAAPFGSDTARAEAIRHAREAALADPDGGRLEQSLGAHGIAPLPPRAVPVVWHKGRRKGSGAAAR